MKKLGLFMIFVYLALQTCAFANAESGGMEVQTRQLFPLSIESKWGTLAEAHISSMKYSADEDAYYLIFNQPATDTREQGLGYQIVLDQKGDLVRSIRFPELDGRRNTIVFDGGQTYSLEYDGSACVMDLNGTSARCINECQATGPKLDMIVKNGVFVYHIEDVGFNIDPDFYFEPNGLPVPTKNSMVRLWDMRFDKIGGYDLRPDDSTLVYGGVMQSLNGWHEEIRIVRTIRLAHGSYYFPSHEGFLWEKSFVLDLPEAPEGALQSPNSLALKDLYTTEDHIVVLYVVNDLDVAYVERYTYEGDRVDGVQVDVSATELTEGPEGKSVIIQQMADSRWEVVEIDWNATKSQGGDQLARPTGRPRSLIAEHHANGKTIADYDAHMFGLVKKQNGETGKESYFIPLRTRNNQVSLRIPYGDLAGKIDKGIEHLLIEYKGEVISLALEDFACKELFEGLSCKSNAQYEIQLARDPKGTLSIAIELVTVEQVDEKNKRVYRYPIQ